MIEGENLKKRHDRNGLFRNGETYVANYRKNMLF